MNHRVSHNLWGRRFKTWTYHNVIEEEVVGYIVVVDDAAAADVDDAFVCWGCTVVAAVVGVYGCWGCTFVESGYGGFHRSVEQQQ